MLDDDWTSMKYLETVRSKQASLHEAAERFHGGKVN